MRPLVRVAAFLALAAGAARGIPSPRAEAQPATGRALTVDTGHVPVPGGSLYYEAAGRGAPMVLLHPAFLDRRVWDPQFAALARTHRVVRFDARGYGRSSAIRDTVDRAADLDTLLRALRLGPAALVGNSLGGGTALDFALAHPARVRALVLVGANIGGYAWPPDDRNEPWRVAARAALARGDTAGIGRAWLKSDYLAAATRQPAVAAGLDTLLAENVGCWKGRLRDGDLDPGPDSSAIRRLGTLRVPTLVVVGSADVADIRHIADTLRLRVPGAQEVVLPAVGHVPSLERPREFLALLERFLARHGG